MNSPGTDVLMEARGVSRSFGPVEVLSDITLSLRPGEVHAVIGENGAGKSTLMKILAGHLQPTRGTLILDGRPTVFSGPVAAEAAGIVLVHQEILLAPHLTVAENLFLGRELRRGPVVDDRTMNARSAEAVRKLGAELDPRVPVARLSIAQRQLVQIARALLVPHRVVIFDEPTASLTPFEAAALFKTIERLGDDGVAVLYISHRLPEVKAVADIVTVLRDGKHVATRPAAELTPADMARLMVGRDMSNLFPSRGGVPADEPVLEVRGVDVEGRAKAASFILRRSEILGFAGLVGAGRTELIEGVVGLRPTRGGEIRRAGRPVRYRSAAESMADGIVYLTEDRKGRGLLLKEDLTKNLTLAALAKFRRGILIDRAREAGALDEAIRVFDIRTRGRDLLAGQLSGGNQQKLLLAKMMLREPEIVIIDEPTRGIDIGTKEQIYRFVAELAGAGKSVILISSEMQELIGLCDRILVMRGGTIAGEVSGERMTEDAIVLLATGVAADHAGHEDTPGGRRTSGHQTIEGRT